MKAVLYPRIVCAICSERYQSASADISEYYGADVLVLRRKCRERGEAVTETEGCQHVS